MLDSENRSICRVESRDRDTKIKARRERRTSAGISAAKGRTKILSSQLDVAGDVIVT